MANTYRKIYLHIIFAVKNRNALLLKPWRSDLFAYMAGIINKRDHFSLAVNGTADHVHIFFDYSGNQLISDLVREIKKGASNFIKDNNLSPYKFEWQIGYGVFSHGFREKNSVIKYILNQEEHHRKKTFREEYMHFLKEYEVEYNNEYVFEFICDNL